jgi:hypothetical protein
MKGVTGCGGYRTDECCWGRITSVNLMGDAIDVPIALLKFYNLNKNHLTP